MDEYGFYDMSEEIAAWDEMAAFNRLFWDGQESAPQSVDQE